MDRAALELGLGKDEIRRRNLIQPQEFPYTCVTGSTYDSGDYPACLRKALAEVDYAGLLADRDRCRLEGRYRGVGLAFLLEPLSSLRPNAYNAGYETVTVRVDPVGKAWVFSGDVNMSMSHKTTLSQVVADELGVRFEDVHVFEGDSALVSASSGSYASRFSTVTISAAIKASRAVRTKILAIAAHSLRTHPEALECAGGMILSRDKAGVALTVKEVANIAYYSINRLPGNMDPGLHDTHYFINPNTSFEPDAKGRTSNFSTFPYAVHVAYVEVNAATGETTILRYLTVDDSGNMVNPMIVDTQITGAISHGVGGAFLEELVYDEQGQLLSGTFADYLIPSMAEMPDLEIHHMVDAHALHPRGIQGGRGDRRHRPAGGAGQRGGGCAGAAGDQDHESAAQAGEHLAGDTRKTRNRRQVMSEAGNGFTERATRELARVAAVFAAGEAEIADTYFNWDRRNTEKEVLWLTKQAGREIESTFTGLKEIVEKVGGDLTASDQYWVDQWGGDVDRNWLEENLWRTKQELNHGNRCRGHHRMAHRRARGHQGSRAPLQPLDPRPFASRHEGMGAAGGGVQGTGSPAGVLGASHQLPGPVGRRQLRPVLRRLPVERQRAQRAAGQGLHRGARRRARPRAGQHLPDRRRLHRAGGGGRRPGADGGARHPAPAHAQRAVQLSIDEARIQDIAAGNISLDVTKAIWGETLAKFID